MFRRERRACVDFAVLPLMLFLAWGGSCLGQTRAFSSAQSADTRSLSIPRVAGDPVKLSFLFMGCNRIQHSDWEKIKEDDPSSANLPQLQQSLKDISQLQPRPILPVLHGGPRGQPRRRQRQDVEETA